MSERLIDPRGRWAIVGLWMVTCVVAVAFGVPGRYAAAQQNDATAFLPANAESTRLIERTAAGDDTSSVVIAYRRAGALTQRDLQRITADQSALGPAFDTVDFSPPYGVAVLVGSVRGGQESEAVPPAIERIRRQVGNPGGGLEVKVTGEAGFAADVEAVFDTINATVLYAAVALVVLLLLAIYGSPALVLLALVCVACGELLSRILGTAAAELGLNVNGQSSSIVSVIMLGVGTDYALLVIAQYRDELRRHDDHRVAAAAALVGVGPAVAASAATVAAALLCLTLAGTPSTRGLGPIAALGVVSATLAMLTLLPALLSIVGRRAFWRPRVAALSDGIPRAGDASEPARARWWLRLGRRVAERPRRFWPAVIAMLAIMSLGWLTFDPGLTPQENFRGQVESIEGQKLISRAFSPGAVAPTEILLPAGRSDARSALEFAIREVPQVEAVTWDDPTPAGTVLRTILKPDPYSRQAYDLIPRLRVLARRAAGPDALVGGPTAEGYDQREAAARDARVIVPAALVVVLLILAVSLRAILGPLALMGTVVLSFAASVGFSLLVFAAAGIGAVEPSLPLYTFVFLIALGTDYNIFLIARLRQVARRRGTRQAVPEALAATGSVITSAGLILAGTFLVLTLLPLAFLIQMGFAIAFGVLLDTFVVRSLLVPALVADLGERTWWPGRLARVRDS